jgi:hypothetical protein
LRHRLLGSRSSRRLGGKGSSFLAPRKPQAPAEDQEITSPRNVVDSNDGVVETCLNMNHPWASFALDFFAICLAIRVTLFFSLRGLGD